MKTMETAISCTSLVTVIALAGCGSLQSGSKVAGTVPSGINDLTTASPQGHGEVVPACTDKRPGHARCLALVLNGRPIADGGSGPLGGFTPAQLESAYNLPSSTKGDGQIVAIVDAYDNANVTSDLPYYRSYFGLPAANFYKYNQEGQQSNYPQSCVSQDGWCHEIDLDVEMVSASCPNCTIYLIEANSNSAADLDAAEAEAVALGAHIVSNSWNGTCPPSYCFDQSNFDSPGVVYLAAAGDFGYGVSYPMAFDSVISVGGTHLVQGGGKRGWTETVWGGAGFAPWGTGGGCTLQPKPSWQHDPGCTFRTANDVAAVADPFTGVSVYHNSTWEIDGGTSVGTPLLAGVFALAGNAGSQDGGRTFWETKHQRSNDLNPVLRGSNGYCSPTYLCVDGTHEYKNYGGPTGWGTPNGIGAF